MEENNNANDGWFQLSETKPLIKKPPIKRAETKTSEPQRKVKHKQTKKVKRNDEANDSQSMSKSVAPSDLKTMLKNSTVKEVTPASEKKGDMSKLEQEKTAKETKKVTSGEKRNVNKYKEDMPAKLHSQTVGKRGPVLEQDSVLHETLETFIHEKILERPVHVKGFGAFGYFETLHSMRNYTKLSFLQQPGDQVQWLSVFHLPSARRGHRIRHAMYEDSQRNFIRTMEFLTLYLTTFRSFLSEMRFVSQSPLKPFCHHLKTI